jgi:hypothetical protein
MKNQSVETGAWQHACGHALQWRLLLLWSLLLWLPILIFAVPTWLLLASALDYSVHAARIAEQFDAAVIGDLGQLLLGPKSEAFNLALFGSLLCTLALSPFLSGMAVTAFRLPQAAGFGALMRGGVSEYGRMLRMLVLGVLPFGLAGAAGSSAMKLADDYAEKAILHSDAAMAGNAAIVLTFVLLIFAHIIVDAGRADLALDSERRSAFKAGWRGLKVLFGRPFISLGYYISISVIGLGCAALLIWLRINMPHVSVWGFIAALLVMQLIVLVLAWMRTARLFALAAIVRAQQGAPVS